MIIQTDPNGGSMETAGFPLAYVIGGAGAVVVVMILVFFVLKFKKNRKNKTSDEISISHEDPTRGN